MLTFIFVILLSIFLVAFISLGYFDIQITENATLFQALNNIGVSTAQIQVMLGVAILFCILAIILFSMLDRIGFTILAAIKPILRLIPLLAFLTAVWRTYSPILFNLLPDSVAGYFGVTTTDGYLAQTIADGSFMIGVLSVVLTMIVFVLVSFALRPGDTPQVRQMKAENAKLKKQVRALDDDEIQDSMPEINILFQDHYIEQAIADLKRKNAQLEVPATANTTPEKESNRRQDSSNLAQTNTESKKAEFEVSKSEDESNGE